MNETIFGFKGFDKDMKCRDFQFEEGKEYETDEAKLCESGFHFCTDPFDVLNYYNITDSTFAKVESTGKTSTAKDGDTKIATTKIKINAKLSLGHFINAAVKFLLEKTKKEPASGDYSQLAASGDYSQLAASGNSSQLAASGYYSQLAASGYYSQLAASGYYSKLAASGNSSKLAASGDSSQLAASGYYSKLAASGDSSQLAASGDYSQLAASGNSSQLAASGYYSKLAASGYSSQLAASGDYSQLAASGNSSQLAASGYYSKLAASGYSSKLELNGEDSVGAAIGIDNMAKGKIGNWITLAEWKRDDTKNRYVPVCVKSVKIDGKKIKADTFYKLQNGKFVMVK